jgi:hypothetical protein
MAEIENIKDDERKKEMVKDVARILREFNEQKLEDQWKRWQKIWSTENFPKPYENEDKAKFRFNWGMEIVNRRHLHHLVSSSDQDPDWIDEFADHIAKGSK